MPCRLQWGLNRGPMSSDFQSKGTLYVVPTPIGHVEDITLRALRILANVPILAAEDTRRTKQLLTQHGLWSASQPQSLFSYFNGNEASRTQELIVFLEAGKDVALVSDAGLPTLSDPGSRLIQAAIARGITVDVLPGPFAATTALIGSGLATDHFQFVGFLPREMEKRHALLSALAGQTATLIMYESPKRVLETLQECQIYFGPQRQACLARELTKTYQEYRRGTLAQLVDGCLAHPPLGEVTLVFSGAPLHPVVPQLDIEQQIRQRLTEGQTPKEIAAILALQLGKSKRQLYQTAILLARADQEQDTSS